MHFNQLFTVSLLALTASSFAATCVPNRSCSALPKAKSSSCVSFISAKKLKASTCTVWKTIVPAKITKTVTVNLPKVTVVDKDGVTSTIDKTASETEFSTTTEYSTTVFLEEASVATTSTETLSFTETAEETITDTIFNYGFPLKKRASAKPCTKSSTLPKSCSCLLTKTTTKTVVGKAPTTYTIKTQPRQTITSSSTSTVLVTVITSVTTVISDTTLSVQTEYSTDTITVSETTQTSETATHTITGTVQQTLYTCVDPNRARCGNYCYRTMIDWYNCGGCGRRCQNNQVCNNAQCIG